MPHTHLRKHFHCSDDIQELGLSCYASVAQVAAAPPVNNPALAKMLLLNEDEPGEGGVGGETVRVGESARESGVGQCV